MNKELKRKKTTRKLKKKTEEEEGKEGKKAKKRKTSDLDVPNQEETESSSKGMLFKTADLKAEK